MQRRWAPGAGQWIEPSKQPLAEWLEIWVGGLRIQPSTRARYRHDIRSHIVPYIGAAPLASLTSAKLDTLYRELEASGRRNSKGERTGKPLSPRTVRSVATILGAALKAAVSAEPPLLARNPAVKAKPPTAKEAQAAAACMRPGIFSLTGMRRGELLALRWRDVDFDTGAVSVRRSVGVVRVKGEGGYLREGKTKTCKPRVVDLDPTTVAVLRAWKRERGALALQLARNDAAVFGDHEGRFRHPERFSHLFREAQQRCGLVLGDEAPPVIRVHDLRHTRATILLRDRENVKVVSERLVHASVTVTLTTYSHVMPGDQRQAATRFAALLAGAEA